MAVPIATRKARTIDAARSLYDRDFYAWTIDQSAAIRAGHAPDLDVEHLAEEIRDLGDEVFHALRGALRVILIHILKWDHQPVRRSRIWAASIRTQRVNVEVILKGSPSLRRRQAEAIEIAYRQARIQAAAQARMSERDLPPECPYSVDDILHRPFEWPDE